MRRGTTPAYALTIDDYDLTNMSVYVTIDNDGRQLTLTNNRLNISYEMGETEITFELTQEETLALNVGKAKIQVRFIGSDGRAYATHTREIRIEPILLDGAISFKGGA